MKIALIKPKGEESRGVGYYSAHVFEAINNLKIGNLDYQEYLPTEIPKKIDIIHYPYFYPYFRSLPLFVNNKYIVTVHDLIPIRFQKYFPPGLRGSLVWYLQKMNLKKIGAIITDSECSKSDITNYANINPDNIFVTYLAADEIFKNEISEMDLQRVREQYQLPNNFILYTGGVNWNKNLNGLVKVCKEIGISLIIAGKEAVTENYDREHIENRPLAELQKEFGEDPNVRRIGFVPSPDLAALYKLCQVYVQPSFYEGFGLPILEAFESGSLVVSSNQGSLPEIYGDAAIAFNPYDPEDMAKKINQSLSLNPEERNQYIKRGYHQSKKFTWAKTAKETLDVYTRTLEIR